MLKTFRGKLERIDLPVSGTLVSTCTSQEVGGHFEDITFQLALNGISLRDYFTPYVGRKVSYSYYISKESLDHLTEEDIVRLQIIRQVGGELTVNDNIVIEGYSSVTVEYVGYDKDSLMVGGHNPVYEIESKAGWSTSIYIYLEIYVEDDLLLSI